MEKMKLDLEKMMKDPVGYGKEMAEICAEIYVNELNEQIDKAYEEVYGEKPGESSISIADAQGMGRFYFGTKDEKIFFYEEQMDISDLFNLGLKCVKVTYPKSSQNGNTENG